MLPTGVQPRVATHYEERQAFWPGLSSEQRSLLQRSASFLAQPVVWKQRSLLQRTAGPVPGLQSETCLTENLWRAGQTGDCFEHRDR